MRRFFFQKEKVKDDIITIDGDDFLHLNNVLRLKEGDEIICFCGDEYEFLAKINTVAKKYALANIIKKQICDANPKANITLFQGLPKGEKLEFIIQKATELGITEIIPFENAFSVAKANKSKQDRLDKISLEACKQCGRTIPLKISEAIKFKLLFEKISSFDYVIFAYENSCKKLDYNAIKEAKNIAIIVGSEGGFSEDEVQSLNNKNIQDFSLGSRILRTETASLALCALVGQIKEV